MKYMEVDIKLMPLDNFDPSIGCPRYLSSLAAGADICACLNLEDREDGLKIYPKQRVLIPTGFAVAIPKGHELQVRPRSGLSLKTGLMVLNSPGTIDADYRGEIKIIMGNLGEEAEIIKHGDRIAQLLVAPAYRAVFTQVKQLDNTPRGTEGFGSTGISSNDN